MGENIHCAALPLLLSLRLQQALPTQGGSTGQLNQVAGGLLRGEQVPRPALDVELVQGVHNVRLDICRGHVGRDKVAEGRMLAAKCL